jgi:hypothetical protein
MDRLVKYSAAALRSGLEERLVQVAEAQGRLLAEAGTGLFAMGDTGLEAEKVL